MEGEELRVCETDVKRQRRKVITRAAEAGEVLGVVQADLEGQRALGGVDHLGVGETHGHLQVVPGLVVQAVVWVEAPGPVSRVLYGGGGVLGLQWHECGDGQSGAH